MPHHPRCFLDGQAPEIAKFDKPALFRIHIRKAGECLVQCNQVHFFVLRTSVYTLVQRKLDHRTATLGRLMSTRMIDKNTARRLPQSRRSVRGSPM